MRVVVDAFGSDRAPGPELAGALRAVRGSRTGPGPAKNVPEYLLVTAAMKSASAEW